VNVIGIVAEYNPFHYGHLWHIEQSKKIVGEDSAVVCVMSGDFVQRGDVAAYSKFARAEAAVRSGVDLVLELPLPWSLSSAEGFARGSVGLLDSIGVVSHISFGSESGNIDDLKKAADELSDPMIDSDIKEFLKHGYSYAAARQEALKLRDPESAALLDTPNNILAVEYLKALNIEGAKISPITVKRYGSAHDKDGNFGPKSASEIRNMLASGRNIDECIPASAFTVFNNEKNKGRNFMTMDSLETAIISRLRMLDKTSFSLIPDSGGGLDNALYNAIRGGSGLDAIAAEAKSKRYAMSRIRRMILNASLGVKAGMSDGIPPYARVLAMNSKGREVLKNAVSVTDVSIITKPADVHKLSKEKEDLFELCSSAHDLYVLGYSAREERKPCADWRTGPFVLAD